MIRLDPKRTALVAIDMHRGHLDPRGRDLAAAGRALRPGHRSCGTALRRLAATGRRHRPRRDRVSRPGGDHRQPVLGRDRQGSDEGAQGRLAPQHHRRPRHRDHPGAARQARHRRRRQETLQPVLRHRPRFRPAAPARRRHAHPCRDQHDVLRAVLRLRGDQPRLPRGDRRRRGRFHGRRGHAPLRLAADGGDDRLAARQCRDHRRARAR